jgi:hypothetical protein
MFHSSQPLAYVICTELCNHLRREGSHLNISHTCTEEGRSRDSVVGVATNYGLDERGVGVRVPVVSRIFSFLRRPHPLWDRKV